jgi:Fe-S-cluster containining protein
MLVTDLSAIAKAAETKEEENFLFREFLQQYEEAAIDKLVFELNETITPRIDCTTCGNCCRSLMINVEDNDSKRLAEHLNITKEIFEQKYLERSSQGSLSVINTIPCHFLHCNKCTVYEARPHECGEFPGLHQPGFTKRSFATFMHYGRCPIVYNVIEALKENIFSLDTNG